MRKIIAILVGLIMLFSVPAFGEETDWSNLTLEELIDIRDSIDKEIGIRTGVIDQQIGTGQYIVGEDIIEGKYEFVCTFVNIHESASGGAGHNLSRIALWTELSDAGEEVLDIGQFKVDQILMIELKVGNVLLIKDANFAVRPYSPEFAP